MKKILVGLPSIFLAIALTVPVFAQKNTLIITTDIGQDPDDQQSLVRLLHYANEFELAGIVANADNNYPKEPPVLKDSILHGLIGEYAKIEDNLRLHDKDYPTARYLHSIVKKGCAGNGVRVPVENYIGEGHDTEGSNWIITTVNNHPGPVCISVWGGACDIAQALWKARTIFSKEDLNTFIGKLRIFFIGKQDSSNDWIINEFPDLWIILADDPAGNSWNSSYRGMFVGGDISSTSKEWLQKFVINENPLAAQYPTNAYTGGKDRNPNGAMKEGDTPAWFYFINNGLNNTNHPEWGGWGGRYSKNDANLFIDIKEKYKNKETGLTDNSSIATVYRWRPDFQQDFAARIQWAVKNYKEANHHPVAVVRNYENDYNIETSARRGATMVFDASPSFDPDENVLHYRWYIYPEAGTGKMDSGVTLNEPNASRISIQVPAHAKQNSVIHLILEVTDDAENSLKAYKRIVIHVQE